MIAGLVTLAASASSDAARSHFAVSVEVLLLLLGAAMTLGLVVLGIWLVRQMLREERERAAAGDDGDGA